MIYLDHAATTPVPRPVADAMYQVLTEQFGNPSSQYPLGREAKALVEEGRAVVAGALGCRPENLHFTSCGTESDNWAISAAVWQGRHTGRHIITTAVEHSAVLEPCKLLQQQGYEVTYLAPDKTGHVTAEQVAQALREDTVLVSMMLVNNENGCRLPVENVFRMVKRNDPEIITHCDAVQGFLKIPFKPRTLCADLVSVSGHKVHALKGVGALYIRHGVRVKPILCGSEQERGLRPGTESVPLIASFGAATEKLSLNIEERLERVSQLRSSLIAQLREMDGVIIRDIEGASPYVLNISLLGYRSEIVLHYLEQREVYVSSGSACSRGASSGVLELFGAKPAEVDSALRISFCAENTEEDIAALVQGLRDAQKELMH